MGWSAARLNRFAAEKARSGKEARLPDFLSFRRARFSGAPAKPGFCSAWRDFTIPSAPRVRETPILRKNFAINFRFPPSVFLKEKSPACMAGGDTAQSRSPIFRLEA